MRETKIEKMQREIDRRTRIQNASQLATRLNWEKIYGIPTWLQKQNAFNENLRLRNTWTNNQSIILENMRTQGIIESCINTTSMLNMNMISDISRAASMAQQHDYFLQQLDSPLRRYWNSVFNTLQRIAPNNPHAINDYLHSIRNFPYYQEEIIEVRAEDPDFIDSLCGIDEEIISPEEFEEILIEQIENPQNFIEKISKFSKELKEKHIYAYSLFQIIFWLFISPYLQDLGKDAMGLAIDKLGEAMNPISIIACEAAEEAKDNIEQSLDVIIPEKKEDEENQ